MMQLIVRGLSLLVYLTGLICHLTSCHYQAGYGNVSSLYQTFSISFVEGDQTGELTAEIIKKMNLSSGLTYVTYGGDIVLDVKLIDLSDENIGFRYDRKKKGTLKRVIIPSETRIKALAEIKITEFISQKVILGPIRLTAAVDFDHTYYTNRHKMNVFSLGQLNDYDAARDAVKLPLYRELSERIVDFVVNSW